MSGSKHALSLPSALMVPGSTVDVGKQAVLDLASFLDTDSYTTLAVVHGQGKRPPAAFAMAKARIKRRSKRAVVWVTDPDLIPLLSGAGAADWKRMLAPEQGALMTFCNLKKKKVITSLPGSKLNDLEIDDGYDKALIG